MKNFVSPISSWVWILIAGPIVLLVVANAVSYIGECAYDDLPNVWSCSQSWALPVIERLDLVVIGVAYPVLCMGVVIAFYQLIRSRFV